MKKIDFYTEITKVQDNDDGTIDVFGVASTEIKDTQGETVTKACILDALPDYFKHGTGPLRAMHQPIAAGSVYSVEVDDVTGVTKIAAKVVDPVEIKKVQTGVYKGFSIGGTKVKGGYDPINKIISKMRLTEISLVDRPANPESVITMWKGEDIAVDVEVDDTEVAAAEKLGEIINKGEVSMTQLLNLALAQAKKEPSEDEVKKGMYAVSSLADVLSSINYLCQDACWEAKSEGDNSTLPTQLRDWLKSGAEILSAMAAEETAEMIASLTAMVPEVLATVAMSDEATDIMKKIDAFKEEMNGKTITQAMGICKSHLNESEIIAAISAGESPSDQLVSACVAKIGAKLSKENMSKLQGMHDAAVSMGASCKIDKLDIEKAAGLCGDSSISDFITKLQSTNSELVAKVELLESQPAAPKAILRVVAKSDDVGGDGNVKVAKSEENIDGPIMKSDGTIDQEATAAQQIMKIHQAGGRSFIRD